MAGVTSENRILSAIAADRGNYEAIKNVLGNEFTEPFSPTAQIVAKLLEDYYSRDGLAKNCGTEILLERVRAEGLDPKHAKAIETVVRGLDLTVSVPNLLHDLRRQRQIRIGDKVAGLLANRAEFREVAPYLKQYQELEDNVELAANTPRECFREIPVEDLIRHHFTRGGTIPFGIQRLDDACFGGARAGHHVLIYARPEVGKTHLALELIGNWVQAGEVVLYGGNEDPLADIVLRVVGRLAGKSRRDILEDPERVTGTVFARGYANFIGVSLSPGTPKELGELVDEYKPKILVIDQLRNLDVGDESRVTALEKAAISIRNLAKSRGIIGVSITQAGESAEGKPFLDLSDIDFSKTGIPGAVDLAIGVGATTEHLRAGIRGISLPKNKLGGLHDTFLCRFNTQIGTVEVLDS